MTTPRFKVVIPARYASTRFPGKVLADIHGKPMLRHVYERALASGAEEVIITTEIRRARVHDFPRACQRQ
jgi:3-deoxy-manno-octulosonate cytidylyltransferase (CMP-KDO synthetase)